MHKTLYRKYRPQSFNEVIGQDIIKNSLIKAIEKNKIAHSYLFSGKSGTGKTTLAKIMAKAVNCLEENKPCNTCKSCLAINDNTTMDIIEMDAASNNGVDQIRNLIDSIQYPPIVCKYKVYIIDEVHMLSTSAFNALLKTLEEPPSNSIFILATTEEHKIPETILTRCQRYIFKKVTSKNISNLLSNIMEKENKDYDQKALKTIADMSNGSVRKALSITEQCIHLETKLTIDVINEVHNLIPTKDLTELISLTYNGDLKLVYEKLEKVNQSSTNYHIVLEDILLFLKDVLVKDYIENNDGKYISVIKDKNIEYSQDFIFAAVEVIKNSLEKIKYSANPKLQFEICIFELTKINNNEKKDEILKEEPTSKPIEEKLETKIEEEIKIEELNPVVEEKEIEIKPYNDPSEIKEYPKEEVKLSDDQKNDLLAEIKAEQKDMTAEIEVENIKSTLEEEPVNEILNILLLSVKSQREFISQKVSDLDKLERTKENSRWVALFSNCKVAAASNDAVIITYEYEASSNVLNSYAKDNDFLKFVKEIFGREYLFVGSWKEQWNQEISNYKSLKENKSLPNPINIEVPKYQEKTIMDKTEVQQAQDLFGDVLELEEFE